MSSQSRAPQESSERAHAIWDVPVRVFHWLLALAFAGAYVTHELGIEYFKYHLWCGYTVLVLVTFRVIWGFIGTRHALFASFVRGPVTTARYAVDLLRRRAPRFASHNPLGAWMVIVLLAGLFVQAFTGLFGTDDIVNFGPLYGYVSYERSLELTSLHRQLFYWLLGGVALHVFAVLAHWALGKERLVHAMFTGRKWLKDYAHEIQSSRVWLAALTVFILIVVLAFIVQHAPIPAADDSFM